MTLKTWLENQDEAFKQEVGDPYNYVKKSISLKDLEELDNKFINNMSKEDQKIDT